MIDRIPTEQDWDDWGDDPSHDDVHEWDREYAKKKFFGKSLEEAQEMLSGNILGFMDEYFAMPRRAFHYYIFSFEKYVLSLEKGKSSDISDAASLFLNLIKYRLENDPKSLEPIIQELFPSIEHIARHQKNFDADMDIYGDFKERLQEIRVLCTQNGIDIY